MSRVTTMVRMLVAVCVAAAGVLLLSAPAFAARGHIYGSSFAETGTGNGQLKEPDGVAVEEATGEVYVVDKGNDRVEYFSASGVYEGQFDGSGTLPGEVKAAPTGKFSKPAQIAIDNDPKSPSYGDVYVGDTGHDAIDKFSPTGEYIGQITEAGAGAPLTEMKGLAVDSEGQLWVAFVNSSREAFFNKSIAHFDGAVDNGLVALTELAAGAGAFLESAGLGVDAEEHIYVAMAAYGEETLLQEFASDGSALDEEIEVLPARELVSGLAAESSSNDLYVDEVNTFERLSPEHALIERLGAGHLTHGAGIAVDEAGETVYVADSSTNTVAVFEPEPPGKPAVESESVSDVTATSATLIGEVNPRGASTEYTFEYGLCTTLAGCATSAYDESDPVPNGELEGASFATATVSIHPQDLQPGTIYHFRLVAHNQFGAAPLVSEQTFTTQAVGSSLQLLDDRAWELVSPANKHGALIKALGITEVQAAADGSAITYQTSTPTDSEAEGYSFNGGQMVSTRGPEGWSSRDIATRHDKVTGIENYSEYEFFAPDLSDALVNPNSDDGGQVENTTLLSPHASAATPYVRSQALCEAEASAGECFLPLFTGKEGYEDVPTGTVFGTETNNALSVEAVTPDLGHVVVASNVPLTATPTSKGGLYEWSGGVPAGEAVKLVSVLPEGEGGEPLSGEAVVGGDIFSAFAGLKGSRNAISDDGARVFWESRSPRALYMRDTVKGETIRLDIQQAGAPAGGSPEPTFQLATGDGTRVFFTDGQPLTAESGSGDLYLCEIVEAAGKDSCDLTDLTPKAGTESAEVRELSLGGSEDGSYIYFVANGVLAPGATHGECKAYGLPTATCNLYVAHEEAGTWTVKFISVLSIQDSGDWATDVTSSLSIGALTARVSPNGRYAAFMSERSLTGYDNRDARTGKPDEEVYLYDAQSEHLTCVSCNPTGARPDGFTLEQLTGGDNLNLADVQSGESSAPVAASLPTADEVSSSDAIYQPRLLFNDGRMFFNSSDALVPQDVNGNEDVYEFELPGDGTCTTSSAIYSERSGGCADLISSGVSPEESGFLDASEDGSDVFFVTAETLVPQDVDTAYDVYDARVCSAEEPCASATASPPECTTAEACRTAPMPQPSIFGAPPSATFSGAGNQTATSKQTKARTSKGLTSTQKRRKAQAQKRRKALRSCRGRKLGKKRRAACERRARKATRRVGGGER